MPTLPPTTPRSKTFGQRDIVIIAYKMTADARNETVGVLVARVFGQRDDRHGLSVRVLSNLKELF